MRIVQGVALAIAVFLAAPLAVVVPMSFSTSPSFRFPPPGYGVGFYRAFFSDPNWTEPLMNSLIIAAATLVLTLLLATPASFGLMRYRYFGRQAFNLLLMMPIIVPHIVMALSYYIYFGPLGLTQSYTGVILAHTCLSLPVATLIICAALKGFDTNLERAAMNLGASPFRTFWMVTLPVLRPAFLIAGLFAFIHSFDESVISLFISGRDAATLPRQMFNSFRMQADPVISAASSLLLYAAVIAVLLQVSVRSVRRRRAAAA
jgi:putative spermidine/putrescine transport system permease protein